MKTQQKVSVNNILLNFEKINIQYDNNHKIVALLRRHKSIDEMLDKNYHEYSGSNGRYNVSNGITQTGIFCFLLVRKKQNESENEVYYQVMNDYSLIDNAVANELDCILVGYDYEGFHEKEYLAFIDYIEKETGWKWKDTPHLLVAKMISTLGRYKFLSNSLCSIDIDEIIKYKIANSVVELIRTICKKIECETSIDAIIDNLREDYEEHGIKFEIQRNKKIIVGTLFNATVVLIKHFADRLS